MIKKIYIGNGTVIRNDLTPEGEIIRIDGERYYRIRHSQNMPDFFISVISDSDHWMFISSNGALTAGRKNKDNSLFPYYTVDKIHDYRGKTGSKTLILSEKKNRVFFWEPFSIEAGRQYRITRSLSKSLYGNKIIFEEVNHDLELTFSYQWSFTERFGFVRKSQISSAGNEEVPIRIIDGIQNIMPSGIDYTFQNEFSNLLNAYKKNERVRGSSLALYSVSSIPVDKAEPSESLVATAVWAHGLPEKAKILLSDDQLGSFIHGDEIREEYDIRARRGAYFIYLDEISVNSAGKSWDIIADINQDSRDVSNLRHFLSSESKIGSWIKDDTERGTQQLKAMVSLADGFQASDDELSAARHYYNVLFNIMRGGTFNDQYDISKTDFRLYLQEVNPGIGRKHDTLTSQWDDIIKLPDFLSQAEAAGDDDLTRIAYEYLPLTFSRRHGDPSRPWNYFSIETKDSQGRPKRHYEGNWRDIFQNWEALAFSFPEYVEGMICKFVNASTIDGNNPYRITRSGIDWEVPEPDNPWAYIGYWGDHQIIYLQKLLELSRNFHPGKFEELMQKEIFVYANVPYRIKPYGELIRDPKDTMIFDHKLHKRIRSQSQASGADASLVYIVHEDQPYKVNLAEKLFITLLNKLGNFIPEAGIWLNTQRPEWNDANNALVGNGTSMVTLYYLRRYLSFLQLTFIPLKAKTIRFSSEVVEFYRNIDHILIENKDLLLRRLSDYQRRRISDQLGMAASEYRWKVYEQSFSGEKSLIPVKNLLDFIRRAIFHIDHTIRSNQRQDKLYHAYNLISIEKDSISIRHLYEMLEGQVAVLSSGFLTPEENLEVLNALRKSKMYRRDQDSFILYPDRELPSFIDKNKIPQKTIATSKLLTRLVDEGDDSIISRDKLGGYHFHGSFRNATLLSEALDKLEEGPLESLVRQERQNILEIYEKIFDHKSFTGRSGTFFGYEGLGSIYWHMVSKLLLATQECYYKAHENGTPRVHVLELRGHYHSIKEGIGIRKKPAQYGSFPTDAYSHTPAGAGVKQPGLTGQVKEDVISRIGELGVRVQYGSIRFDNSLLDDREILRKDAELVYVDPKGSETSIKLKKGQLGFTFCHIPIIYDYTLEESIRISYVDSREKEVKGLILDPDSSRSVFRREGKISMITVGFKTTDPLA